MNTNQTAKQGEVQGVVRSTRISAEVDAELQRLADEGYRSVAGEMRMALEEYVARHRDDDPRPLVA